MILRIGIRSLGIFSAILAENIPENGLPGWAQYGVLGVLVIAFFTDQVVSGRKYNAVVKERDDERARTEKAEAKLEEKFLPALQETQLVLKMVNEQILPVFVDLRKVLIRLEDKDLLEHHDRHNQSQISRGGRANEEE